jgi:hypothetical protein
MRRKLVIFTLVAAAAAALPAVLLASHVGRTAGNLDRQAAAWRSTPVSTSSSSWRTLGRLSFVSTASGSRTLCARNGLSVSLAVSLKGAPVRFRVLMDGGPVLGPGSAQFSAGAVERSFAYTFVGHTGTFEGSDLHALEVQWRSPSGRPVTLTNGVANALYELGASC